MPAWTDMERVILLFGVPFAPYDAYCNIMDARGIYIVKTARFKKFIRDNDTGEIFPT